MSRSLLAGLLLTAAVVVRGEGRTWTVGGQGSDFPLIAPALEAAGDGDTVLVRRGVYREDLVLGRRVALVGEGRPVLIGTGLGTVIEVRAPGCDVRELDIESSGAGWTGRLDAGVFLASSGNRIAGNRLRRVFYGIVVQGASGNEIRDNEIAGLADLPFGRRGDGVFLYRAPGNLVVGNRVSGMRDAMYIQYSPRSRVARNAVSFSRYGLHDMFSDDARIEDNVFRDCSVGANVMNCRRITIKGNRFERNRGATSVGLALKECDASLVADNDLIDNARGLQLEGSSSNRFEANRFRYNDTALMLFASAEENVFTGNTFRDNGSALLFSGSRTTTRFADRGRGNLWASYRGFDFDGDGVGDTPEPLLAPFEKLEGNNPAVRLFLQSPAAGALDLAARVLPMASGNLVDPSPLVDVASRLPGPGRRSAWPGLLAGAVWLGLAGGVLREVRPCSKSRA